MDPSLVRDELVVLAVVAAMTAYWWFALVPSARVRLAKNKRDGTLRAYLETLKQSDASEGRQLEKWFYAEWLSKIDPETRYLLREDVDENVDADADFATPTTSLRDTRGVGAAVSRQDAEPSVEDIIRAARKTPKFFSLDNPVLVGTVLCIGVAALASGGPPPPPT